MTDLRRLLGLVLGFLLGLSGLMAAAAAPASAATVLSAPSSLPAGTSATVRIDAGDSARSCSISARSGRTRLGPFAYSIDRPIVSIRWRVPKYARSLTWKVSLRCATSAKRLKTAKPVSRSLEIDGRRRGVRRLFTPASVRFKTGDRRSTYSGVEEPPYGEGGKGGVDCSPGVLDSTTYCSGYCTWYAFKRRPADDLKGLGNADTWYSRAQARGIPVGRTPRAGAIAWWSAKTYGPVGHVAYVERVEGNSVVISEMNFRRNGGGWNKASTSTLPQHGALPDGYIYGGPAGDGVTPPPASADSDGDGVPDGQDHCPSAAGPPGNSGCPLQVTPSSYQSFAGDFNGDHAVDLGLRDARSGMFYFRFGPSFAEQTTFQWDNTADYQSFAGDFNGDRQVDAGLRNPATGMFYARYGPGFADQTEFKWDNSTAYQSFAGDFNGDAKVDFGLRDVTSGMFYARYGPGFADQTEFKWDNSTAYQSFAGDFNGDAKVDFGLRNISSGMFYIRYGPGFTDQTTFQWAPG